MVSIERTLSKDVASLRKQINAFLHRAKLLEQEVKRQPRIKRALRREIKVMRKTAKAWSKTLKRLTKKS